MIELLESRIAPASIAVTFLNGLVTAKVLAAGDAGETLAVSQPAPGDLKLVAAGATFHYNGMDLGSLTLSGVTGLSLSLGTGDDIVTLTNLTLPKNVRVDMGDGTNLLTVTNGSIGGSFTAVGTTGLDTFTFNGNTGFAVGGKTNISMGAGNNKLTVSVPTFTTGNSFSLTSTAGNDTLKFDNDRLGFGGKFSVNSGTGEDSVTVHATESLVFGRDATISSTGTTAASVITQSIKSDLDLVIGGIAKLISTTGNVAQELVADTGSLFIGRGVTMSAGPGKSAQAIDSADYLSIGGNVTVSTKAQGTASLDFSTGNTPAGTLIKGNVALTGHTFLTYYVDGTLTGNLTVRSAVGQAATVYLGASVSGDTRVSGTVSVATGESAGAASTVQTKGLVVGGAANFFGAAGNGTTLLNDSVFFGKLTVDMKDGNDEIRIDTLGTAGTGIFTKGVVLRGGTGNDRVTVGGLSGSDTMIFRSTLLIDGGAGTDTLVKGTNYPASLPPTVVNVEL